MRPRTWCRCLTTRGNAYSAALSPTVQPGIPHAGDLLRGGHRRLGCGAPNTVTVNFDAAVSYADVRVAEYGGIARRPVDGGGRGERHGDDEQRDADDERMR